MEKGIKELEKGIKVIEERKRNIVIREIRVKEGKRREAVEEIMWDIGVKIEIEEVGKVKENAERSMKII